MNALEQIESFEARALKLPQVEIPTAHIFSKGIYWRQVDIPAGVIALGHTHKSEHLNVLLSGHVKVFYDGKVIEMIAPQVFVSPPGVRKLVYALTPTRWANVHANPTDETDPEGLESIFIEKSAEFANHEAEIRLLKGDS